MGLKKRMFFTHLFYNALANNCPGHVLDVDIDVESLKYPEAYPFTQMEVKIFP